MFNINYNKTRSHYRVFSGVDILPVVYSAGQIQMIGNLRAVSLSTHVEKHPARSVGKQLVLGYKSDLITHAGTFVFVDFDYSPFAEITGLYQQDLLNDSRMRSLHIGQVPPFDIIITYQNEYGSHAYNRIFGVHIQDTGTTQSIEQLFPETSAQYYASAVDYMTPIFEHGSTVTFNDSLFYGRYDLNNIRSEDGTYISELLGKYRNLQQKKAVLIYELGLTTDSSEPIVSKELDYITEMMREIQWIMDNYNDIDISQSIQTIPYLSRVIDTSHQVTHDRGKLIDFYTNDLSTLTDRQRMLNELKGTDRRFNPDLSLFENEITIHPIETTSSDDFTGTTKSSNVSTNGTIDGKKNISNHPRTEADDIKSSSKNKSGNVSIPTSESLKKETMESLQKFLRLMQIAIDRGGISGTIGSTITNFEEFSNTFNNFDSYLSSEEEHRILLNITPQNVISNIESATTRKEMRDIFFAIRTNAVIGTSGTFRDSEIYTSFYNKAMELNIGANTLYDVNDVYKNIVSGDLDIESSSEWIDARRAAEETLKDMRQMDELYAIDLGISTMTNVLESIKLCMKQNTKARLDQAGLTELKLKSNNYHLMGIVI